MKSSIKFINIWPDWARKAFANIRNEIWHQYRFADIKSKGKVYEKLHGNKLKNLDEMAIFLEIYRQTKFTKDEIDNLNSLIYIEEM